MSHPERGDFGSTLGYTQPLDHGYEAWTYDPALLPASQAAPTAGVVYLMRMSVPLTISFSSVAVAVSAAGSGLSNTYLGVYTSLGSLIGTGSTDQSTAFQSTGLKITPLVGTPLTALGGPGQWVYGAFMYGAGTTLQMQRAVTNSVSVMTNSNQTAATFRAAQNSTGLTALPATLTLTSNAASSGQLFWMALA